VATLSTETGKRGTTYRVLSYGSDGRRHTIRLGHVSKQTATTARNRIAALEAARAAGVPVDVETTVWLTRIDDAIHERLVKAELVEPREEAGSLRPATATLGEFLQRYFATLGPQKRMTELNYGRARRLLEEFFGKERRLSTIHAGDAEAYRAWLLSPTKERKAFALASASVDLRRARQFFAAAVRRKLLVDNPFAGVRCGSQANAERLVFVDRPTITAVIEACPTAEWRLVFALARYAGLRIPSELEELKWSDVNWERSRLRVRVPKLAHHAGKEERIVPIFAELRPYLEAAFDEAEEGAVYVVPRARGGRNLRRYAEQVIDRASVEKWPRLFQNLRSSREVELMREYPAHVVLAWIGHTAAVARSHYLHATDEDFDRAAAAPAIVP
jgi:integrase